MPEHPSTSSRMHRMTRDRTILMREFDASNTYIPDAIALTYRTSGKGLASIYLACPSRHMDNINRQNPRLGQSGVSFSCSLSPVNVCVTFPRRVALPRTYFEVYAINSVFHPQPLLDPQLQNKLQGMLKEIRTLVSSTGSASAANAAVVAPTRRASALFSQVAENEYRRHSVPYGDVVDNRWAARTCSRRACIKIGFRP